MLFNTNIPLLQDYEATINPKPVTFYGQFHYLFSYNLPALLCLPSFNSKVLIRTLGGTHTSSGFDTPVQLPVMHLLPCKCQNTAAERLPPCTWGIITLQSASALFTPCSFRADSERFLTSVTETPQSVSPGTVTLIANSRFCFLWMLRKETHRWKPEARSEVAAFSLPVWWRVDSHLGCVSGESTNWIPNECLGFLSLPASEELISLSLSLTIPLRRRTGEGRGTSGSSGREWEAGKERGRGRRRWRAVFRPGLWLLWSLLSPFWGGGRHTHAGCLSNAAGAFMKSLQRQGRQALFLSPNWFSCSRCSASDFTAAGPPPSCPHSLLPPDLETYLQRQATPLPAGPGWAGLRQASCLMLVVAGADHTAGSDSSQMRRPGRCLIAHPPVSPALGNTVPQRNFINRNALCLNMCPV